MHNVNRSHHVQQERGRQWRSGPGDEEQRSIPGVTAAELQIVDLNRATEQELAELDGLNEELARSIVAYRVHHGHFESWEDLRNVPAVESAHIRSLQHAARIGGPADVAEAPARRDDPTAGGLP